MRHTSQHARSGFDAGSAAHVVGDMIGTHLRDYRIVTELGAGGMGVVYYAEHTVIGRRAAIKLLNPQFAKYDEVVQRFFTEARTVNAIRHPNIVDVTDFGKEDAGYFIIMEFLQGETIGSRLERIERFDELTALSVLSQVASAVGAANAMGIVHRDLKTENIFLTNHPDYPDFVKVLDFGIVKLNAGSPTSTAPGMVIGTPSYMSPEQWMGEQTLDHRSDIYSFCVVAYEMLTGRLPFTGDTMAQMQGHLRQDPPSLRSLNPAVSAATEALVMRGLAKSAADRFSSMNEMKDAIKAILEPRPVEAPRINTPPPASSTTTPPRTARQTQTMGRPLALVPPPAPAPAATPASTASHARVEVARQSKDNIERAQNAAVERAQVAAVAEKLREILLRKLADNTLQLPSLPAVAFKCLELLRRPETSFREVSAVLEGDPLITARLLRVVNSSLYGVRGTINSVETAVSRLGMKSLTTLLQEMSAEQVFASRDPRIRAAFKGVWDHCLAVAHLSRTIAAAVADKPGAVDGDTAYMAGLVHDIGKPIVAVVMLEAERMLLAAAGGSWVNGNVWVASVNGCHREVGASLAARWELPAAIVDAILRLGSYDEELPMGCRNVVRFAHAIAVREGWGASPTFDADEILRVIMQGRALLQLSENVEETAVAGLRHKLDAITAIAAERR